MDKLKVKARTARNRVAETTSRGDGRGSLAHTHSTLPPDDNASTAAVNEGFVGTAARDFAVPTDSSAQRPVVEPPTSLQSSVDAGTPVPTPRTTNNTRGQPSDGYEQTLLLSPTAFHLRSQSLTHASQSKECTSPQQFGTPAPSGRGHAPVHHWYPPHAFGRRAANSAHIRRSECLDQRPESVHLASPRLGGRGAAGAYQHPVLHLHRLGRPPDRAQQARQGHQCRLCQIGLVQVEERERRWKTGPRRR